MKTVLYLIQASAGLPKIYECLQKRSYLLLSYKEDTSDTTIYAPDTTWAEGRNRLYQYVKDNNLLYDYYIFMDEDAILKKTKSILIPNVSDLHYRIMRSVYARSFSESLLSKWLLGSVFNYLTYQLEEQEAGFEYFEESLKLGYPIMGISVCGYNHIRQSKITTLPKEIREKNLENLNWVLQTVPWMDDICNALSQEVFFANTVLPYTVKYDADTWWVASFIFTVKSNLYYPNKIIQNNEYSILNTQHVYYPRIRGLQYRTMQTQVYTDICAEAGVDKIQFSEGKEIKPHLPLKQVEGRFMSRFGFFVKFIMPAIFYKLLVKIRFYLKKMLCRQ